MIKDTGKIRSLRFHNVCLSYKKFQWIHRVITRCFFPIENTFIETLKKNKSHIIQSFLPNKQLQTKTGFKEP